MVVEFELNFTLNLDHFEIFLFVDCLSNILESLSEVLCVLDIHTFNVLC